jgi:hypothetical protein
MIGLYQAGTMMNKKELIRQYKETVQPMGIYQIRNAENGKLLIGSARNLNGMLNRHKFQLENNLHGNRDLQREFNEAGGVDFSSKSLTGWNRETIRDMIIPKN